MRIEPTKTVHELLDIITYLTDIENGRKIYHSWRVAILAARIADRSGNLRKTQDIFYAALLHDVGGVGFPHHIIHYLERNDKTSQNTLLSHPIVGAQMVSGIPQMANCAKLILDHDEWVNGRGYPRAKSGKNIPLGAQIIRLADAIDILLQKEKTPTLKEIKKKLFLRADQEYPRQLLEHSLKMLGKNRFFYRLCQRSNIPEIFHNTQRAIGPIHIPSKIDAIGTTLEMISQIIDMKHPFSSGHSLRVSRYAIAIALAMNLTHDEITYIKWAGLIHDIGKLNVPRRFLSKRTKLTSLEYKRVKEHAHFTEEIINMVPTLRYIIPFASSHHEYFDGSGYPLGLEKEQIPLAARILCVCDAFDAMTSNRPYRNPLTPEAACKEIQKCSGKQFDPHIVKIAIPLFKNLGL